MVEWYRTVEIDPLHSDAHYALAWIFYRTGDAQKGIEHARLAIEAGIELEPIQDLFNYIGMNQSTHIQSPEDLMDTEKLESEFFHLGSTVSSVLKMFNGIEGAKLKLFFLFVSAFLVRLSYLYYVVPVDWVGDSYHHWQIAWYTLNIGFRHGRLWDLKGVEYYWPPLPSLIEAFLMWLFRSSSIFIMRFTNMIVGSCSVVVSYIIGRRFNEQIGQTVATALLFFPFTLNYEILALHEPMMILFGLLGILMFLDKKDFMSGLFLGLSYLCHFTVYIMAPIIFLSYIYREKSLERTVPFLIGFGLVYIPYVYVLLRDTGDAFYNIRTLVLFMGISTAHMRNPLANILGPALLIISFVALIITYYKIRTRSIIIIMDLFCGYSLFWGFLLTFVGAPLSPYEIRYYGFMFILSFFVLIMILSRTPILQNPFRIKGIKISKMTILIGLLSFILFISVMPNYTRLQIAITDGYIVADKLGEYYVEGTVISPVPDVTYRLTNTYDIKPQNILGPIYAPTEHEVKMTWLQAHNVTLFFWLPGFEADRVFPELSEGRDSPPFYILDVLPFSRFIYEVKWD